MQEKNFSFEGKVYFIEYTENGNIQKITTGKNKKKIPFRRLSSILRKTIENSIQAELYLSR